MKMDTQGKTKAELKEELHKLGKANDILKTQLSKEIEDRTNTEQLLLECENNLKERIKELNGIFSLSNLAEELNRPEDIYHSFVNSVVPGSMQYPEAVFVSLEIDRKKFINKENFILTEGHKYLSAPIKVYGKQAGELIVTYTEDLPSLDYFEQTLIKSYAERISKISERIKTQNSLEESEIKYRNLVENLGEGIGIVDINEEFVFVNSVAERIFGVGEGELFGKSLKEYFSEEEYKNILYQSNIRRNSQSSYYETEITLKDGERRPIQITAVPNLDIDGNFIGTYGVFRDISERKKVEKALQKSEERLRSILENSADAIFIINQQGMYLYTNKAVSNMLGYRSEELKCKSFTDISPPDKIEEYLEIFRQILSEGKCFAEIELLKKDGSYLSTDLNAVLLPDGMVYGSCRNIAERKQAEQALKESEKKLLQLNADKDRFIAILGHDLKNPISNILGFSELLKEDSNNLNTDDINKMADNINKSALITNKLLEDILLWARAQQGMIPFNPQNISLGDICKDVIEVLTPTAVAKNIAVNYIAPDGVVVYTDIDMLKTVIRNLVSNAIKFTNSNGKIGINAEQASGIVIISVSDNGVGIPPENLAKLFDISEVLTTKGTAAETGTGLGLLLCKEFVERHGGKIWVESETDRGSEFFFMLPSNAYDVE